VSLTGVSCSIILVPMLSVMFWRAIAPRLPGLFQPSPRLCVKVVDIVVAPSLFRPRTPGLAPIFGYSREPFNTQLH
jgi:hypothetical protein